MPAACHNAAVTSPAESRRCGGTVLPNECATLAMPLSAATSAAASSAASCTIRSGLSSATIRRRSASIGAIATLPKMRGKRMSATSRAGTPCSSEPHSAKKVRLRSGWLIPASAVGMPSRRMPGVRSALVANRTSWPRATSAWASGSSGVLWPRPPAAVRSTRMSAEATAVQQPPRAICDDGGRRRREASTTDGALELSLVHLRPALDALLPRLVVELVAGSAAGALVRPEPTAPARRDVIGRRTARLLGLARASTLLVDGARGDLLGGVLLLAAVEQALLDVLVLTFPLVVPRLLWHRYLRTVLRLSSPWRLPGAAAPYAAMITRRRRRRGCGGRSRATRQPSGTPRVRRAP